MTDYVQVITTTARRDEAEQIARTLIDARLAACVQIVGPVSSTYRWQGQVETAEEWQCLIKSKQAVLPRLVAAVRQAHPYQVPEILVFPVLWGSADYLAWIDAEVNIDAGA
jgi:periplasmic divalent cation tolerance protein